MGGLGDDRQIGIHRPEYRTPPLVGPQHPQVWRRGGAVRRPKAQSSPQDQSPDAGMGVALGFGLGIDFLQGNGPPGGLIQPPGQALPAVRQGLKIGQVHGPQASEYPPFIVLQRGRISGFEPPGQNFPPEEGGGGELRVVPPVVARPHPGNGKDLGEPAQPPGGLEVLHGQIVVGPGQTSGYVLTQQRVRCRLAAGGKGQALLQKAAQFRLEPPAVQTEGQGRQGRVVPALTAKGNRLGSRGA